MIDPLPRGSMTRACAWHDRNTPVHVDIIDMLPGFERHGFGRRGAADAGIVDSNRKRAELRFGLLDRGSEIGC